jgi:hypothetical protein
MVSYDLHCSLDRELVPTVIAHSNICYNFLQNRLPFHEFFVLCLSRLQFCSKFLCSQRNWVSAQDLEYNDLANLDFSALKKLCILPRRRHFTEPAAVSDAVRALDVIRLK